MGQRRAYKARPPELTKPFEPAEHIAVLPAAAKTKGMYLNQALHYGQPAVEPSQVFERAGIEPKTFRAFLDYPYEYYIRLMVAAAQLGHPDLAVAEGIRRIGRGAYEGFLTTQIGKVIYAATRHDIHRALSQVHRGYKVSLNFGQVSHEHLGSGHAALHFRGMPAMLESCQLGVVEGGLSWFGVEGQVEIELRSLSDATLELWWSEKE